MAKSQCSLAVASCSICLSTSATDKLQLLFFLPQTTFSKPVSTLCNSEFKSLQLSKGKQIKADTATVSESVRKNKLTQEVPVSEWQQLILFKECPFKLPLFITDRLKYHDHMNWNRESSPIWQITLLLTLSVQSFFFFKLSFLKDSILRHCTFT